MTNAWADNALWPGDALVARISEQVPELREVLVIDSFDPKDTEPRQLPACVVALAGLTPVGNNAQRAVSAVEQDWLVILAVRNAGRDANANAAEIGPLIPRVVRAVLGWKPEGTLRTFEWRRGPRPIYGPNVSYFPLLFGLQMAAAAPA